MRRMILAGLLSLAILLATAGTAMATHCHVADKPLGAGTNGGFLTEDGVNVFKRDLAEPAHERGQPDPRVLELEE
jgi:hypothetical protein